MNGRQSRAAQARAMIVMAACLAFAAPAFAQNGATPPPAGAAFIDDAPAGGTVVDAPPAPPPAATRCGAQNCVTLELSEDALRVVQRGGDPAQLAEGIAFSWEGARPPALYLVAARYENGRLAQYANTKWVRPDAAGTRLAFEGVERAIVTAASRFGRPPASLAPASAAEPVWLTPVLMQGFVIESPRTYLIGDEGTAPIDRMSVPPALAERAASGPVLFIAVVPSDYTLRTPEQTLGTGVVIALADGE